MEVALTSLGMSAAGAATASTILSVVGTGLSVIGSMSSARAERQAGAAQQTAANYQADQMKSQAGQERASAQRASMEQRRRQRLAQSRLQALSAASGAGAMDPTVLDLSGDLAEEGEYRALTALYEGEERARGLETGANVTRYEGAAAKQAAQIRSRSTLLSAGSSLLEKYS